MVLKLILLREERCPECGRQQDVFEELRSEAPAHVEFRDIVIGDNPDAARYFKAREHPTLVLEKDGHEVRRWTGVVDKATLLQALEAAGGEARERPKGFRTVPAGTPGQQGPPGKVAMPPPERMPGSGEPSPPEPSGPYPPGL